jgi:hypothetical protein
VIQIKGYHYYNKNVATMGGRFVNDTLVKALDEGTVEVPDENGVKKRVPIKELGLTYPVLVDRPQLVDEAIPDPTAPAAPAPARGAAAQRGNNNQAVENVRTKTVKRFDFIVQIAWQPKGSGQPDPATVVTPSTPEVSND